MGTVLAQTVCNSRNAVSKVVRMHNVTLSIIPMFVHNPDRPRLIVRFLGISFDLSTDFSARIKFFQDSFVHVRSYVSFAKLLISVFRLSNVPDCVGNSVSRF